MTLPVTASKQNHKFINAYDTCGTLDVLIEPEKTKTLLKFLDTLNVAYDVSSIIVIINVTRLIQWDYYRLSG